MKPEIKTLVDKLIHKLHVDQIYQWTYQRDGKKLTMLHIHIIQGSGMRYVHAKEICEQIFKPYTDVFYTLYYQHEIQQFIQQGLARFQLICRPENKIYQNDNQEEILHFSEINSTQIIKNQEAYIQSEQQKTTSFLEGYRFYLEAENYAHAAFMLHQSLELTLRTALMLLVGYEKKSHCLASNINLLKTYDSILGKLNKKDKNSTALRWIDESYAAFRYKQGFKISKQTLETTHQIVEETLDWLKKYQVELAHEIREEFAPERIALRKAEKQKEAYQEYLQVASEDQHKEIILEALRIYYDFTSVRCFAYRNNQSQHSNLLLITDVQQIKHHYYVLITVKQEQTNSIEIQGKVNQLLPDHLHITCIIEQEHVILKKAAAGKEFYYNVLGNAELWHENESVKSLSNLSSTPHISKTYLLKKWSHRLQNARTLMGSSPECHHKGDERITCFILAVATEQICFGLIRTFLGYSSPISNLHYLMELVDSIAPNTTAVFRREQASENKLFKRLSEAQRGLRFTPNYSIEATEVDLLYNRVLDFINRSDEYVKSYLTVDKQTVEEKFGLQVIKDENMNKNTLCAP